MRSHRYYGQIFLVRILPHWRGSTVRYTQSYQSTIQTINHEDYEGQPGDRYTRP